MSKHDVFLSHNSKDKGVVEEIARRLVKEGIDPWLDKWNLIPGEPWQPAIEEALDSCSTCVVFIGTGGTGPWQNEEMRAAIDQRVRRSSGGFRVIPVLLPGAERGERSRLPTFLVATTWVEFHSTLDDEDAFYRLLCGIKGIEPGPAPGEAVYEGVCPYRGLEVFDVEHAPFFFGREVDTEWSLNKIRQVTGKDNRFLGIIGPSGSGKSSLARAGVIATLKKGALKGSESWPVAICRPGTAPLESLAVALTNATQIGKTPYHVLRLEQDLSHNQKTLHLSTRMALHGSPPQKRLVILVDQFEELFTLCKDRKLCQTMIDNLIYASTVIEGQTIVILTMRADFYGRCASYPELAAALSDHPFLVGEMSEDELQRAIEGPAHLVGCEFEPGLTELLLKDIKDQAGGLPLLQYALLELWRKREGHRLTRGAYNEIGGVEGALEKKAEEVFEKFTDSEKQICRKIFLRLTQAGEGTEDTKRQVMIDELMSVKSNREEVESVIQSLSGADARLVTVDRKDEKKGKNLVEVSHEALIRGWKRFRNWLNEDREFLLWRQRLRAILSDWEKINHDESILLRGGLLAEAQRWLNEKSDDLSEDEQNFIRESVKLKVRYEEEEKERQQRELAKAQALAAEQARASSRLRLFAGIMFVISIIIAFVVYVAYENRRREQEARRIALSRRLAAQATVMVEKGQGNETMQRAAALAVESWKRMRNAEAYVAAARLLSWIPVVRIEQKYPKIERVVLSPDGRYLATSEYNGPIRLIEIKTGKELTRVEDSIGFAKLDFSPDSHFFLTFYKVKEDKGYCRLIDTATGEDLLDVIFASYLSPYAAFSSDSRFLAVATSDTIKVFDTHNSKELPPIKYRGRAMYLFFSPDGRLLAVIGEKVHRLIEIPGGREQMHIFENGFPSDLSFIGDGRYLAIKSKMDAEKYYKLRLFDVTKGTELLSLNFSKNARVSFSDNGQFMVIVEDQTVRLLKVPTGKELALFKESKPIKKALFSGNGRQLFIITDAGTIRLIDTDSKLEKALFDLECEITRIKLDVNDRFFVSACRDGQVFTIDTVTGIELARFELPGALIYFSPDAKLIVAYDKDEMNTVWLIETLTGNRLTSITNTRSHIIDNPFSKDSRYFAISGTFRHIYVADISGEHHLQWLELFHNGPAVMSSDGKLIAISSPDRFVRLIEIATGRGIALFQHKGPAYPVDFTSNDRFLMTREGPTLHLIDIATGKPVAILQHEESFYPVKFSRDGQLLVTESGKIARLIDTGSLKEIARFTYGKEGTEQSVETDRGKNLTNYLLAGRINDFAFSPDDNLLAIAVSDNNAVYLINTSSGKEKMRIKFDAKPHSMAFSPDRQTLAVETFDNTMRLIDVATGVELKRLHHHFDRSVVLTAFPKFSPDGRTIAMLHVDRLGMGVYEWLFDTTKGRKLAHVSSELGYFSTDMEEEPLYFHVTDFSRDSRFFAVGATAVDPARLFETATGKELARIDLGIGFKGVLFSPNGQYLAAASSNGAVKLIDTKEFKELAYIQHADAVTDLTFSPDSHFLATASQDGTVRLIDTKASTKDTEASKEVAKIEHTKPVESVSFSPDGKWLITRSDTTTRFFRADPQWPFDQLCARMGQNLSLEEWQNLFGDKEQWRPTCENWRNPDEGQ